MIVNNLFLLMGPPRTGSEFLARMMSRGGVWFPRDPIPILARVAEHNSQSGCLVPLTRESPPYPVPGRVAPPMREPILPQLIQAAGGSGEGVGAMGLDAPYLLPLWRQLETEAVEYQLPIHWIFLQRDPQQVGRACACTGWLRGFPSRVWSQHATRYYQVVNHLLSQRALSRVHLVDLSSYMTKRIPGPGLLRLVETFQWKGVFHEE